MTLFFNMKALSMTNKEKIQRDIELTFDFVRQIINNPTLAEQLPDKCEIDFIFKDFTSLTENRLHLLTLAISHAGEIGYRKAIRKD